MIRFLLLATALVLPVACGQKKSTKTERIEARTFPEPTIEPPPVQPPPLPGFVAFDAFEDALVIDLQDLQSQEREDTRYLIGCDRFNISEELEEFGQGINRGINGLSTERFITPPTPIGSSGCIFRINLTDYDITTEEWQLLEQRTLLQAVSRTTRGETIQFYTQTERPWLFADDMMLTAYEGDALTDQNCTTYCDLVEQPILVDDFFANEGVNLQEEFDREEARCGGTNESKIALGKGRIICQVESDNGWLSIAYDSSLAVPDSINENPFTDEMALANPDAPYLSGDYTNPDYGRIPRTTKIFQFQAQEMIGVLPNGLQLFRLNGNDGVAATAAPADVVQNYKAVGDQLEGVIRIAACTGCHTKGSEGYTDELFDHISERSNFNSDEKTLARVFMKSTLIRQAMNEIDERHGRTLNQMGIDPTNRDAFTARLITPLRNLMDAREAAAKFFLTPEQYRDCLSGSVVAAQNLGAHLTGGRVSLQVFTDNYETVIEECNLFEDVEL